MRTDLDKAELIAVYDNHPLREDTLLARLREKNPTLTGLNAADLAVDERAEVTDQNHVGGLRALRDLAGRLAA